MERWRVEAAASGSNERVPHLHHLGLFCLWDETYKKNTEVLLVIGGKGAREGGNGKDGKRERRTGKGEWEGGMERRTGKGAR